MYNQPIPTTQELPKYTAPVGALTHNYLPGINVGNALSQLGSIVGLAPKADYDVLDNYTNSGRTGQASLPNWIPDITTGSNLTGSYPIPNGVDFSQGSTQGTQQYDIYGNPSSTGAVNTNYATPDELAYLRDQGAQLRALLGRTNTNLEQGLSKNQSEYQKQLDQSNLAKQEQLKGYGEQRTGQMQGREKAYGTINQNANQGYRSLAQIIGRGAGTGSSAYQELLPNVIGRDISSKRGDANETYGQNLRGIDTAQNKYNSSFEQVLKDLEDQRLANESNVRSNVEGQRQGLYGQIATNEGQIAQGQGGGYAAIRNAQQPYQDQIEQSRNAVEGYFNQFKPNYTPQQAVADAPELSNYTVDRANVNAQNQGMDESNPYASLLRKKLQSGL